MVEVEAPAGWPAGDGERGDRVEPSVVEAVRQHQQVAREPVAADVRHLPGRVRLRRVERVGDRPSALGAARVVPAVGAHPEDRFGTGTSPVTARHRGPRDRGRRPSAVGERRGLEPGPAGGVRREDPGAVGSRAAGRCRRTRITRTPATRDREQLRLGPSGSRASRRAFDAPGAGVLDEQEGARPSTRCPRGRRAEGWRGRTGTGPGRARSLATSSRPSRTSRRQSTSRLWGSRCSARSAG